MVEIKFKYVQRDSDILVDLYKHRFLTISQIQRLHFPSLQTTYRRMRLLKQAGYASPFTVPNIEESIFALAGKGIQAVAESLGVDKNELKWTETRTRPHDYYFMQHFIAINDFRIALRQACENSTIQLLGFIPDYYGEKTAKGGITKYIRDVSCDIVSEREEISHTPDGVFALRKEGKSALFFLEIDRGTETVSDSDKGVLKAVRFYLNYLLEGKYQRYAKDFNVESFKGFRTLFLTTSEPRIQNIRKAAAAVDIPEKAKRFLWLSTYDRLNNAGIFNPIWVSSHEADAERHSLWGKGYKINH
jgi:hypothetical protein